MKHFKLRWVLPSGHLLIDCVLLFALIAYGGRLFGREKSEVNPSSRARKVLVSQEDQTVTWDPATMPPSGPFLLIMSGNLPAGIISATLRPRAGIITRGQHWDVVWFLAHETAAFLFWYLIGMLADSGRSRLGRVMIGYLTVRGALAVISVYDIGWRIEVLFWLGFIFWLIRIGLVHLICRRIAYQ